MKQAFTLTMKRVGTDEWLATFEGEAGSWSVQGPEGMFLRIIQDAVERVDPLLAIELGVPAERIVERLAQS